MKDSVVSWGAGLLWRGAEKICWSVGVLGYLGEVQVGVNGQWGQ